MMYNQTQYFSSHLGIMVKVVWSLADIALCEHSEILGREGIFLVGPVKVKHDTNIHYIVKNHTYLFRRIYIQIQCVPVIVCRLRPPPPIICCTTYYKSTSIYLMGSRTRVNDSHQSPDKLKHLIPMNHVGAVVVAVATTALNRSRRKVCVNECMFIWIVC